MTGSAASATSPCCRQRAVLGEIRAILREHPETSNSETVGIPYRVDAMYAKRLRRQRLP
ncbi:MAG TPA: hypothetical protein VMU94_09635 [Streptosporangiaceae bacterium]|nr:hypothetical protein [Streptosporangiaceae bacterium]